MTNPKRYTLTAALPYANGPVHIGHLAGVYIPADIYARYQRLRNQDVLFVCGSDEHGVPVTLRARAEGVSVQEVVDKYDKLMKTAFADFGISFDIYSRTSKKIHYDTAQEIFKKMYEEGKFEEKTTAQFYDESTKMFLADRLIMGTCPKCSHPDAYGDQCESCGSTLSPDELINPRSMVSGNAPIKKDTKHWYLPLNKYENWLREWILEGHKDWKSNVYGQCKSWIEQGLLPRAVTRDLDWGVPLPIPNTEGKVMYVWFDAPIGYISATKDYFLQKNGTENADTTSWEKYWKDSETKLVHFIGKDNIVFHCIIFPVILKAEGSYILPENVPANEFLNLESKKISTSRNWAVWLHEYLVDFPEKQDVLRYVLTANAPETKDNNFLWKDFQDRNNNELAANLGNYVNRVFTLTHKYFEGNVPNFTQNPTENDLKTIEILATFPKKISDSLENYRFKEALSSLMELSSIGNKYLQDNAPWTLAKNFEENKDRINAIMNLSLQIIASLTVLMQPFLPFAAQKLKNALHLGEFFWNEAGNIDMILAGQKIENLGILFDKIEDEAIATQVQKLFNTLETNKLAETSTENKTEKTFAKSTEKFDKNELLEGILPSKSEIVFDDFMKMDLRVATILHAEKMPKSDKLLKIRLNTGLDERVVLSGIGKDFTPEEIIGKQVCVLINLAPRKMMGEISQGMILMAKDADGSLAFVAPSKMVESGSDIS